MENSTKFKIIKVNNKNNEVNYLTGMEKELTWIKNQISYYSFLKNYRLKLNCLKGEIYEIDFGVNINAEFSYRHYGLVLKDSPENNPLVLVCPLKTNKNGPNQNSDLDIGHIEALHNKTKTLAIYNQIRAIDKIRIYKDRLININKNKVVKTIINNEQETSTPRISNQIVDKVLNAYYRLISDNKISN